MFSIRSNMLRSFPILAVFIIFAISNSKVESLYKVQIIGGHDTDISHHPWQISLQREDEHWCGGSLITNKWVLTAAHCVDEINERNHTTIVAGVNRWNEHGQRITVKRYVIHEKWNPDFTMENDIALLELLNPASGPNTRAIQLPPAELSIAVRSNISVTGWGFTTENGDISIILQEVILPYVSLKECIAAYGNETVTPLMNCAGFKEGGKGSCIHDSGGPAVYRNQLIGIVSFGIGCAAPNYPDVFTNVPKYVSWIKKKLFLNK